MAKKEKKKKSLGTHLKEIVVILSIVFIVRTWGFGLYQVPTGSMETTMLVGERFFADKFTPIFMKIKHGDVISLNDPLFNYSDNSLQRLWQKYVWGPSNWTKRVIGLPGDIIEGKVEDGKPVVYRNGQKLDETYVNKYPLIAEYKKDPAALKKEARKLLLQGRISVETMNAYPSYFINWRSYDPAFSYRDQPFYRIDPNLVVKNPLTGDPEFKKPFEPIDKQVNCPRAGRYGKSHWSCSDEFYVELGPNQYWLMGDNRRGSQDSRFFGPINGDLIHGKIVLLIMSIDQKNGWKILNWSFINPIFDFSTWWIADLLAHPIDFWKRVRWSRSLRIIR